VLEIGGACPQDELIVLDGKEPRHDGGHSVLMAARSAAKQLVRAVAPPPS
jgi:hypothetical protein